MILLTNDDGIDAPGLAALSAAIALPHTIIAPRDAMSECSHRVTTKAPIPLERRSPVSYAVGGTPADCVRVALYHLAPITWVLSGINDGGNLGADVYISGTIAAVREAAFHGVRGIAFSQYRKGPQGTDEGQAKWARASRWAAKVFALLQQQPLEIGEFWNVNFPALPLEAAEPEVRFCPRSRDPLPVKYQANGETLLYQPNYHARRREAETDVALCFAGLITISKIEL
jgi:5'-nucleotidase